jgi:integrase
MKGVARVVAKGRTYYYAWRGGPRLPGEPGSPEFHAAYAEAVAALVRPGKDTVAELVAQFRASDRWQLPADQGGLADSTKKNWKRFLGEIENHFGKLRLRQFSRPEIRQDIKRWRNTWAATPRTADYAKQVLSALLAIAVDDGRIATNPCVEIKNLYAADRSDRIWAGEDLQKLEAAASAEVFLAARLAALTGLRQGDLLRLSWSHVGPLAIEMRTGKSTGKKRTLIPIYGELRAVLDAAPRRATTVLTNSDGLPWKSGFGSSWNKTLKAAKLAEADLHFHDLRGTAATRMFLADLSIREIAEILAWSEDRVERLIARYVKKDELLRDRIRRMDEATQRTS